MNNFSKDMMFFLSLPSRALYEFSYNVLLILRLGEAAIHSPFTFSIFPPRPVAHLGRFSG